MLQLSITDQIAAEIHLQSVIFRRRYLMSANSFCCAVMHQFVMHRLFATIASMGCFRRLVFGQGWYCDGAVAVTRLSRE